MTTERRRTTRHPARESQGELEWAEGPDFRAARFHLRDISQGGVGIVAEDPVPLGRPVWIRLADPIPTRWVSAKVVRIGDEHEVGVAFSGQCPYDFRAAATLGIGFDNLN
ncbi:PilZ domain-containing protein [Tundrisphaera lichenicola]|uniref:PilZ domain-containing protein n=1 Tax=Tundrisphaera lichenicola TaxID=2029860 RepID=UPI003EB74D00